MKKISFFCFSFLCLTETLISLPQEPSVVGGSAQIHYENKKHMTIKTSEKAIINYKNFNIDSNEKVQFIQPNAKSCVLNRITGGDPSKILGKIESNGSVFLVNPNGIYFGNGAKVNVGGLIASTLNITDESFMEDRFSFFLQDKNSLSKIYNEGTLSASNEGAIVLMAPIIKNTGIIKAHAGQVVLASAEHVTLRFEENKLLSFCVEGELKDAVLEHLGSIQAKEVSLKLPIAKKAIKEVVNHDGIEHGIVFVEENGKILLAAESSIQTQKLSLQAANIQVNGEVLASSADAQGGAVQIIGKDLSLKGATIDTSGSLGGGSILIGGAYRGEDNIPYASTVFVDSASRLICDATSIGDGGIIVLWSYENTSLEGRCYAKGGALGGNGGIVESSSLGNLFIEKAQVNTLSTLGEIGYWLLDPTFIRITSIGGSPPSGCSTSADIAVSTIQSQASTVTLCANTILQEVPINMSVPGAGLIFQSPIDATGVLLLQDNITTIGGPIDMSSMEVSLLNSITLNTTNGGSSGADILIGKMNADSTLSSLTLNAGTAKVVLNKLGDLDPLGAVQITAEKTYLGSIFTNSNPVTIGGSIILQGEGIINTANTGSGAAITLGIIDGFSIGTDSLTLNAGEIGTLSIGNIGSLTAINNFTVVNAGLTTIQNITSFSGSIDIEPTITLTEPLTKFTVLAGEGLSSIHIASAKGTTPYSQSLTLTTTSKDSIVLGQSGIAIPLNEITLTSNQKLSVGNTHANTFKVTSLTGQTTIEGDILSQTVRIEAGNIILKGSIETDNLSLIAHGSITSKGGTQHLLVSPIGTTYINALNGTLGQKDSPVSLITENKNSPIIIGARDIASISGLPYEKKLIVLDPLNSPCLLYFNKNLIRNCNDANRLIFELIPKMFFKTAYFNARNLGIGMNMLAQLGPYFLSSYYTENFFVRVENPKRIEEVQCGQNREYFEEASTLPDSESMSSEDRSKS